MSEPFVSVILAVRNEAAYITRCLGAVLAQEWPADRMEVLVADGESTDGTADIIRAMPGSDRIQLLANPGRRTASGLNVAIARSSGEIIVRVDGHAVIAPDYISRCVATLAETNADCVGGRIDPVGLEPIGSAIAAAARTAFAVPGPYHVSQSARYTDTVYLGSWPTEVLAKTGGYDESLRANEDYELNYRIRRAGGSIYLSPTIRSTYYGRQNLRALARQYFWYGVGKVQMLRKHPTSAKVRHLVAPLFIAALLCALVSWYFVPALHVLWLVMLLFYALLNLGFSAVAFARGRSLVFLLTPLVYLTMHLAWGCGFWVGLVFGGRLSGSSTRTSFALANEPRN